MKLDVVIFDCPCRMRTVDTTIARIDRLDTFDDNIVPVCVIRDATDDVLANDRMLGRC